MSFMTYTFFVVGIAVAGFFMSGFTGDAAYQTVWDNIQACTGQGVCLIGANFGEALFNGIIAVIANPLVIVPLALTAFVGILTGGSFGLIYIIPILILSLLINIFVLPAGFFISSLATSGLPFQLGYVIIMFFNTFMMMSIIGFIRGSE